MTDYTYSNKTCESLDPNAVREAIKEIAKTSKEVYKLLGSVRLVVNEMMPPNEWFIVCGTEVYKGVVEACKEGKDE